MSARILVVDDVEANVRLLEAKLRAEYYEVVTASDGPTALVRATADQPDIILLDVMMPGMDGFTVCRRLKDDADTRHIPVVLVTALDGRHDRITGLEAGADDFLTKPVDDVVLFARVRALTRLKQVLDELRRREASGRRMGLIEGGMIRAAGGVGGRVLIVDDQERQAERIAAELSIEHRPIVELEPEKALLSARGPVDLMIINAAARTFDGLRLAAQIRSDAATRHLPILAVLDADNRQRLVKALEIGVNDVLSRPVDPQELAARARTQIKRKRYSDFMRDNVDQSIELAVTDPLTGLQNRRYMTGQLKALMARMAQGGEPVATLLIDMDHFKSINDTYGHAAGDEVLKEFALRLATSVRAIDVLCRYGGEEFVVVMPDTQQEDACRIAERIRLHVAGAPFRIHGGRDTISATISIGVASSHDPEDTLEALLQRADEALYEAKSGGRNRVVTARAA